MRTLAALLALPALLAACAPAPVAPRTVSLRMRGSPQDASVIIDEEDIGPLAVVQARGVALPPGVHHITVQAAGYFPWDKEVQAKEGDAPIHLDVTLLPVPD
jgi:hypothetical protein